MEIEKFQIKSIAQERLSSGSGSPDGKKKFVDKFFTDGKKYISIINPKLKR